MCLYIANIKMLKTELFCVDNFSDNSGDEGIDDMGVGGTAVARVVRPRIGHITKAAKQFTKPIGVSRFIS